MSFHKLKISATFQQVPLDSFGFLWFPLVSVSFLQLPLISIACSPNFDCSPVLNTDVRLLNLLLLSVLHVCLLTIGLLIEMVRFAKQLKVSRSGDAFNGDLAIIVDELFVADFEKRATSSVLVNLLLTFYQRGFPVVGVSGCSIRMLNSMGSSPEFKENRRQFFQFLSVFVVLSFSVVFTSFRFGCLLFDLVVFSSIRLSSTAFDSFECFFCHRSV